MKKCPYCLAEIHEATIICPHCNSDLMETVPIRVVSAQKIQEQARKRRSLVARIVIGFSIVVLISSLAVILILLWNSY